MRGLMSTSSVGPSDAQTSRIDARPDAALKANALIALPMGAPATGEEAASLRTRA